MEGSLSGWVFGLEAEDQATGFLEGWILLSLKLAV